MTGETGLIGRIEADVRSAMLAREEERRDALRLILASLRSAEKDLLRPLTEDEELQVLQRERKRRIEAAAGRYNYCLLNRYRSGSDPQASP